MVEDLAPALTDLEFHERRRILVVTPLVLAATEATRSAGGSIPGWFLKDMSKDAKKELKAKVKDLLTLERRGLLPVTQEEAKVFAFQPGHPETECVYVANPVERETYYPLDSFHRQTFEHKFREVLGLLIELGPRRLVVYCEEGWGRKFSLGIEAPGLASGKFNLLKLKAAKALFEGEFPLREPRELQEPVGGPWYEHEQTWKSMVKSRLQGKVEKFGLSLEYSDDYGITAAFADQVEGSQFEVGGKFTSFTRTVWRFEADFRPSWLEKLKMAGAAAEKPAELEGPEGAGDTDA